MDNRERDKAKQQKRDSAREYQRKRRANLTEEEKQRQRDYQKRYREQRKNKPELMERKKVSDKQWRDRQSEEYKAADLQRLKNSSKRRHFQQKYAGRDRTQRPNLHNLGSQDQRCNYCSAVHFASEKTTRGVFSSCCGGGSVALPPVPNYPTQLQFWLERTTDDGKHFINHIRKYNSAFAFASFGCQPVHFKGGLPVFAIHGQVYHRTAAALSQTGDCPSSSKPYAELYILDPEFANTQRMENSHNVGMKKEICQKIDTLLRSGNPFARAFKMMQDLMSNSENQTIQMWITKDRLHDPRRYNLPIANEVAAIFVSENGEPPFNRDIAIHPVGDKMMLQQLRITSPNCDPMIYPLLFPSGEPGWQPGIKRISKSKGKNPESKSRENVSMLEFYSYRLQERQHFNALLHAGKLTQQYIIDAFMKVEGQRLEYNRQNQKQLRVELYLGLMDYVNSKAEEQGLKPGRITILPSSFKCGKRALQQEYQDAMTIVAAYGRPDLFITFTCNPKWPEIQDNLKFCESATDRADLVSDVFHLKLKDFLNDLTRENGVFGKSKAFVYTIEFQKRGLPHCHLLLILSEEDKLRTQSDVDSVVCAEIPNKAEDPELYEIVTSCMIHGPCGPDNNKAPCMEDNKGVLLCSKNFPKDFIEETDVNVNGYPRYRRRDNGNEVLVRGHKVDNRWVVPYNPYLSRKYNAHINVEVCSSVQSIKYIFKYVYKGHDAAFVQVSEGSGTYNWDEIRTYLDARYIAAPEAMWRLRKYEMSGRSHSIERLPVHLPSQQAVYFEDGEEEKSLREAEQKGTKLTKWFLLNNLDSTANKYLYCEIPKHYVWKKDTNTWEKRQKGGDFILPRMYAVPLRDMERFCLRLLLMHQRGAKSYEQLRTIHHKVYPTFQEAAKALGLLDDDKEWEKTMQEAAVFKMPSELPLLFATILVNAHPTNGKEMYEKFREDLIEDFGLRYNERMAEQQALNEIKNHLMQFGKSCEDYGIPTPTEVYEDISMINVEDERKEAKDLVGKFNDEQHQAYTGIMTAVKNGSQKCFHLSGAGGCGKTFVYKALIAQILSEGGVVKVVAPTGLAATLLKGGKTVHSGFGIPIKLDEDSTSHFKQGSPAWRELLKTKLIIWDEISMSHAHLFNAVDKSLRLLLNCDKPFGGIPIVVGGDFRQQAPVVQHGKRVQIIEACVKSSPLWKQFVELKLVKNMRVNQDEVEFVDWLLDVGSGKDGDFVKLDRKLLTDNVIKSVFGEDINSLSSADLASMAILCPKNSDTLKLNENILSMLNGDVTSYFSVDTLTSCESEEERALYPMEFVNSLTPMGLPPHILNLKRGSCVMLLRNLNPKHGLCNGTRLIVESLGKNLIECSIFSGQQRGKRVLIPRIPLDSSDNSDVPFKLRRKQFPIRLAYSITITKSQGQTFDKIGLYLPEPVFCHGQLYTALSRVRTKEGLAIEIKNSLSQGKIFENDEETYTYNCVYSQILNYLDSVVYLCNVPHRMTSFLCQ